MKFCDACKGKTHFKNPERCPKSKRNVHGVNECGYSDTDSSSRASIGTVTTADVCTLKSSEDSPVLYCNMVVNKQLVKLQVDCGATVNGYLNVTSVTRKFVTKTLASKCGMMSI